MLDPRLLAIDNFAVDIHIGMLKDSKLQANGNFVVYIYMNMMKDPRTLAKRIFVLYKYIYILKDPKLQAIYIFIQDNQHIHTYLHPTCMAIYRLEQIHIHIYIA